MTTLDERCSDTQFGRSAASHSSRCRNTAFRIHTKEEITQPIRRKHTAESARHVQSRNLETADHEYNESSLPLRQRTNSATSIDTLHIRPTATKLKNDTDVVIPHVSAPCTHSASPTSFSFKQGSQQSSFFQSITTTQSETSLSLSLCTASAQAPPKKKSKKSGGGPVPKPLPRIFNVGQSSLLSGLVTLPTSITATTTHSDFSLDDIPSWNMDTLPSIHSPPHSPITQNKTITATSPNSQLSYSAPSDAPFSTPYDEDALLENEIPFPFNKHSGVIIENMGIKKAKNLNKAKDSLLNRHITTAGSDLHPHSTPTLSLTLPSVSRNTTDLNQLAGLPLSHPSMPKIPVGPSSSKKDAWGCVHLGPADYELSIAFPQTSHFEVWDMDDEACFACPLFLCLMAKNPRLWTGTPISLPDVSLVDIRCDDRPVPSTMSVYDPSIEYAVQCTVTQNRSWNRGLPPPYSSSSEKQQTGVPFNIDPKEITLEGKWEKTYTSPKKPSSHSQTQILRIARNKPGEEDGTMNGRGWYLKFWIPVPARLFLKRETRIFEIKASVWMMSMKGDERVLNLIDSEKEADEDFPLLAGTEMTVSHLRRERDMSMR